MTDRAKLTKRSVDAAKTPAAGELRLWDEDQAGLCLRLYSSGRKVYALKYRVGSRQRWMTLGEHGKPWAGGDALTPDEARKEAVRILGAAHDGRDASQERRDRRTAITVAELIDRYLDEGPKTKPAKRASSWAADKGNLNHHVRPLLGKRLVKEVTRSDVARMVAAVTAGETAQPIVKTKLRGRAQVRGGAGIAERAKAAVSAMFSWGIEHGVGKENPARAVKLAKRAAAARYLSSAEAGELLSKLDEAEKAGTAPAAHAAVIRLLLLTGARKGEIEGLAWSEVDLDRKRLTLPPERTKAGGKTGERRIALNSGAVEILAALKGDTARKGLVFPAARGKGHRTGVQKTWEAVRLAAGLPGVRLHDLRHSFASFAVADGASLYLVAKALGHADPRTTQRYAHLGDDPLDALAEAAGRRIGNAGRPFDE